MADRYWVGGTANWDGTAGTKWSTTSGGAGGASVPTSADAVFFTNLSTGTCTISTGNTGAASINCTGFAGTIAGTAAITVSGSVTLSAGMTYSHTGTMTFNGTGTLTTAGKTFSAISVNGVGITVTLGDALNISTRNLTVTGGTFNTANFSVTASFLSSSNSNTRTITLGSSTVTLSSTTLPLSFLTSTNLTFNANTSQITLSGAPSTLSFSASGQTFYNVSFTSSTSGSISIRGANTFNNLTFTTPLTGITAIVLNDGDQTVNGTLTLGAANTAVRRIFIASGAVATPRTITLNGSLATLADVDFRDITAAGSVARPWTGTRLGNCGGNTDITFDAGKTVYWNQSGTVNWSSIGWATTNNGVPATNNFPLAQDTATFTQAGSAGTVTIEANWNIGTIQMADGISNRTTAFILNIGTSPTIYGDVTYFSNLGVGTGTGTLTFSGTGTQTIISAGLSLPQSIVVNKPPSTTFLLGGALTTTNAGIGIGLTQGTIDLNGYLFTSPRITSNNTNTRSISFGSANIALTVVGSTMVDIPTATNFTCTGTGGFSRNIGGSTSTFSFGSTAGGTVSNAPNLFISGGGSISITSGSYFKNVDFTGYTGNIAAGSSYNPAGDLILSTGGTFTSLALIAYRASGTITTNGKTIGSFNINVPSGTVTLNGSLTASATTLTNGTLDLGNATLSATTFSSANSNTRSIAFGTTGNIVLTSTSSGTTVLSMANASNFTFTGTSSISAAMTVTRTFRFGDAGGATTSNRLNINLTSGTVQPTFTGSFRQVNFTGSSINLVLTGISCHGFTLSSGGTFTDTDFEIVGTGTLTSNGKTIKSLTINESTATVTLQDNLSAATGSTTTSCTLTTGTLDLNNFTFSTNFFSSSNSNTRAIAFGTTGSIVLNTTLSGQENLVMGDATNFTFTGTSNISADMSRTRGFRFGSTAGATTSNRLNINLTSGASTPTFLSGSSFRQINFTGSTLNPGGVTISCHGFTLASGGTYTSTNFTTVGDGTLTYTGKSISTLDVNTTGITTTLASAGQNATTTLTNGTLDLAGFTLTSTTTAATAAGTKDLTFNGGTLVCSAASSTAWNNTNPTGFTTTAGTGTGTISMTGATAKFFNGGGSTYNCTLNQGGAGTLTITGANTFNDITNTNATASQITFPANTTTTVNNFTLSGSAGNLVSIRTSSMGGNPFTLSKSSGTVSVSFLDIQDSNATGGASWQAYFTNGNVDSGNNTGWIFSPSTGFLAFFVP